jgi:hypothetical protein
MVKGKGARFKTAFIVSPYSTIISTNLGDFRLLKDDYRTIDFVSQIRIHSIFFVLLIFNYL